MTRVTGIGGVFIRAKDHARLSEWYRVHLDIDAGEWGKTFQWDAPKDGAEPGSTAWSIFKPESTYFPTSQAVMINYRVADLRALVAALKAEGCNVDDKIEETDFGKFGWVTDPEGNRIELWEPPKGQSAG
ncbi:MAG: VOC family protein [Acidobacteria bacterium]|nr:MAG: VOC family protein [Acidobacteriota bacterium]